MKDKRQELLTEYSIYLSEKGKLTPKEAMFYVTDFIVNNPASSKNTSISSNEAKKRICFDCRGTGKYGSLQNGDDCVWCSGSGQI